jgi:alkanesulfonate monooxygenase SsuD/methylene tetrahydromethanopterin reductase-like flavin-dependent oxidoreductase (luciferase family)
MVGHLRPAIDAGSKRADRPAGSVGICVGTPTVVDVDRVAARDLARRIVSIYLPVVPGLDPTMNDPEWLAHVQALAARGDYEQVASDTSDEMQERFVIAGNPDDVVRQVRATRAGRCLTSGVWQSTRHRRR